MSVEVSDAVKDVVDSTRAMVIEILEEVTERTGIDESTRLEDIGWDSIVASEALSMYEDTPNPDMAILGRFDPLPDLETVGDLVVMFLPFDEES